MLSKQIRLMLNTHIQNLKWYDKRITNLIKNDTELSEKEWHKQWEQTIDALNNEQDDFENCIKYINARNLGNDVWKSLKYYVRKSGLKIAVEER